MTNLSGMFFWATAFNQDLSGWDVSSVTDMSGMFRGATSYNQDISGWDVSRVLNMGSMFRGATSFNQDLSGWNVTRVKVLSNMFNVATVFNQDLSGWDVSNVIGNIRDMFHDTITLEATLQRTLNVSSFFEGVYRDMPREERRQVFAVAFSWKRRIAFMLFLVNHGYLYSASAPSNYKDPDAANPIGEVVPCDMIFDVEDIYRYICKFL